MSLIFNQKRNLIHQAKDNFFLAKKYSSAFSRLYIKLNNLRKRMNYATIGLAIVTMVVSFFNIVILTAFIALIPGVVALVERTYNPVEKCRTYNEAKNKLEKYASDSSKLSGKVYSFTDYITGEKKFDLIHQNIQDLISSHEIVVEEIDNGYANNQYPNSLIKMVWDSLLNERNEENVIAEQSEEDQEIALPSTIAN